MFAWKLERVEQNKMIKQKRNCSFLKMYLFNFDEFKSSMQVLESANNCLDSRLQRNDVHCPFEQISLVVALKPALHLYSSRWPSTKFASASITSTSSAYDTPFGALHSDCTVKAVKEKKHIKSVENLWSPIRDWFSNVNVTSSPFQCTTLSLSKTLGHTMNLILVIVNHKG